MIKILIDKLLYKLGYIKLEHHNNLANSYAWALVDIKEDYEFIDSLRDEKLSPEAKVKINNFMTEREWVNDITVNVVYEGEVNG